MRKHVGPLTYEKMRLLAATLSVVLRAKTLASTGDMLGTFQGNEKENHTETPFCTNRIGKD